MKKNIITLLTVFIGIFAFAQESGKVVHTIKGKVIDAKTNAAVSYTNIGMEDTYYGTASDAEGNFELKIPAALVSKNIFLSAVGFKGKKFPVKTLFNKEFNVIKLEAQSYGINDIDVAAQSKVLIRILRMASENIPVNYVNGPVNMQCNYINEKRINDTIQVVHKAKVLVYDENAYAQPSKLDAYTGRKYSMKSEPAGEEDYRFSTGTTNMDELLDLDWVRSASAALNPDLLAGYQLKLKEEIVLDGKACWVISVKQKVPTLSGSGDFYATTYNSLITIGKDDYDVKKIEGKIISPKNSPQGKSLAVSKKGSNYLENMVYSFETNYGNLKPVSFILNKAYEREGKKIVEKSELTVESVQTTNLTILKSRDYFISK